ncbi:hypothetical protein LF1_57120 [Rubripirellula obstinata]|uniref:Transposase zinc-binding domain-containing protein n=1 Tax=Rubripirellula obstinata TaxID=406547 RepID=A0A5B1CCF2_9BACT|nr:transposase zinc-binding domain-containing protein [Rubripirellula obstinata]KAA1257014.1 hypothetical protein LF1_57120 [Rubripirellula obstinata]
MSSVALALRVHAPEYLERFGDRVPLGHRKVLGCITRCRTGELGGVQFQCDSCGSDHWVGRSCGNRHCPNCQKNKTSDWLAKQTDRLLPGASFSGHVHSSRGTAVAAAPATSERVTRDLCLWQRNDPRRRLGDPVAEGL